MNCKRCNFKRCACVKKLRSIPLTYGSIEKEIINTSIMTNYNSQARKPFIPVITPERIQLLVKEYGSPAKVAKAIGVHRMTIVRWAKFGIPEGSPYLGKF